MPKERQIIDVQSVVEAAKNGDQVAAADLFEFFRGGDVKYFEHRFPGRGEDLAQEAGIRTLGGISSFRNRGPRPYDLTFLGWRGTIRNRLVAREIARTTRTILLDEVIPSAESLSQEIHEPAVVIYELPPTQEMYGKLRQVLVEAAQNEEYRKANPRQNIPRDPQTLDRYMNVIKARHEGKTFEEIAVDLQTTPGAVAMIGKRARSIIEARLFVPAGYQRVSFFARSREEKLELTFQLRSGTIAGFRFMGLLFASKEGVSLYDKRKQRNAQIAKELRAKGYVSITLYATPEERMHLKTFQKASLVENTGAMGTGSRYFISLETLAQMREKRTPQRLRYLRDLQEDLSDVPKTLLKKLVRNMIPYLIVDDPTRHVINLAFAGLNGCEIASELSIQLDEVNIRLESAAQIASEKISLSSGQVIQSLKATA